MGVSPMRTSHPLPLVSLWIIVALVGATAAPAANQDKLPVPDAAKREKSRTFVHKIFYEE
jgi:hypothetical protein